MVLMFEVMRTFLALQKGRNDAKSKYIRNSISVLYPSIGHDSAADTNRVLLYGWSGKHRNSYVER